MEEHVWSTCQNSLNNKNTESIQSIIPSIRSLITNPHTSNSTISSILETLTRSFQVTDPSLTQTHSLKLLIDLATHRPHLSSQIFSSIHSIPSPNFNSLSALYSISLQNPNLKIKLDDSLFVSSCFDSSVSERLWLLKNGEKFGASVHVLLTVFLGFTKDPYPYVRKEASDGLVRICSCGVFDDKSVIEGCFFRGIELLNDKEDCVRFSAVNLVSEWGLMLILANDEESRKDLSDAIFLQLCSMVRDMSMGVRVGAFNALGKLQIVSEEILLQSLSKKVLPIMKQKKCLFLMDITERSESLVASAAGAFVHGLEDEFYEVRKSACYCFRKLVILSATFADGALNLLMDMLNDDTMVVTLEALETLHHMATHDCLNVQEMHMHMFLGTLVDNKDLIRSAARKVFALVKLPTLDLFRLSVDGLLKNLDMYPQDEADVFSVLFHVGRSHKNFTVSFIMEVFQEIEPASNGNMNLDSARIAAFLVLSISAPLSCDQNGQSIPARFFSYAVTLLGRISFALKDIVNQDALLPYLFQCSRDPISSEMNVEKEVPTLPAVNADVSTHTGMDSSNLVMEPLPQIGNKNSVVHSLMSVQSRDKDVGSQLDEDNLIWNSLNLIIIKVKDAWLLVQSGCIDAALKTLRVCKEELAMLISAVPEYTGALAFMSQYTTVIKLLASTWGYIAGKMHYHKTGELEIRFGKLERKLREIRSRFFGFSKEEESHVFELVLVTCVLRLLKPQICCYRTTLKRLSTAISHVEYLNEQGSIQLSNFAVGIKKTLHEIDSSGGVSCNPFVFMELVKLFSIKQFNVSVGIRHLHGTLDIPNNDFENPLPFVSGLPVSIPLFITLHNISRETRLWLKMAMTEESVQFFSLDLNILGGSDEVKKFTFSAPFYRTPKARNFTLRVCIGTESMFEEVNYAKRLGGPKRPLVYLCPENEVYLCRIQD